MGKSWDSTGIAYNVELWKEALRVLKPGGHLLAFGGTRTYHRMACAIEDAGFEIRDQMQWIYGSGFPKSMDISKAIDKQAGVEREIIGKQPYTSQNIKGNAYESERAKERQRIEVDITIPTTPEARQWQGWGTALKPANEPIVVARKPLSEKTVADNVLKWGTGGINIDKCRIPTSDNLNGGAYSKGKYDTGETVYKLGLKRLEDNYTQPLGRFPANVIFDEEAGQILDEQAPNAGAFAPVKSGQSGQSKGIYGNFAQKGDNGKSFHGDGLQGASRFFYCAKAGQIERNIGLDDFEGKPVAWSNQAQAELQRGNLNFSDGQRKHNNVKILKNFHPTVKPIKLIKYLIDLVTPPNGISLDIFEGSGTHALACIEAGFNYIGFELEKDYFEIAKNRIASYSTTEQMQPELSQISLFEQATI